jgi:signal peptidase I
MKFDFKSWPQSEILDFLKDLVIIVVIVVVIRSFIVMPFQISGQSMYSSYYDREFIIVDRLSYFLSTPERWDVIVFKPYVSEQKKYFLKRVIWMPWDTLKIDDGDVYIKTESSEEFVKLEEDYLNDENNWYTFVWSSKSSHQYKLWEDQFFVIWDNRNHSTDSRECFSNCIWRSEFIWKEDMVWKVFLDLWYFNFKKFDFIQPNLWIDTTPRFFSSPSTYNYDL